MKEKLYGIMGASVFLMRVMCVCLSACRGSGVRGYRASGSPIVALLLKTGSAP